MIQVTIELESSALEALLQLADGTEGDISPLIGDAVREGVESFTNVNPEAQALGIVVKGTSVRVF